MGRRHMSLVALLAVLALAPEAQATGLRALGSYTLARDTSYDMFSFTDRRRGALDLSFSYSLIYMRDVLLFDVEGGYLYHAPEGARVFSAYNTELESHSMYLGLRLQVRVDRKAFEWIQPYVRTDFGWMWSRAELKSGSDRAAMKDWGGGGFIYVAGGVQLTIPVFFIREKIRLRLTKRFSIGFMYEFGYIQTGPIKLKLRESGGGGGDVEPIPVEGFRMGSLDLSGITHTFGAVITF